MLAHCALLALGLRKSLLVLFSDELYVLSGILSTRFRVLDGSHQYVFGILWGFRLGYV